MFLISKWIQPVEIYNGGTSGVIKSTSISKSCFPFDSSLEAYIASRIGIKVTYYFYYYQLLEGKNETVVIIL